jgi:hypothetical protein
MPTSGEGSNVELTERTVDVEEMVNPVSRVCSAIGTTDYRFQKWEGKHKQPCEDVGDINFVGRAASAAKFARVASDTDPGKLRHFLEHKWKLQPPEVLLAVTGTAAGVRVSDSMPPRLVKNIKRGLVLGAQNTGAWILTTGSSHGVSEFVGEAFEEFGEGKQVPLIGIMPWGKISGTDQLEHKSWRNNSAQYRKVTKEHTIGHNHSHFILVDSGREHWADEDPLRIKLEEAIIHPSRPWRRTQLEEKIGPDNGWEIMMDKDDPEYRYQEDPAERPSIVGNCSILIVIGGGPGTLTNVYDHVLVGPVIVVAGSGRAANLMQKAKTLYEESHSSGEIDTKLMEGLKALVQGAGDVFLEGVSEKKRENAITQLHTIVKSESVEVYDAIKKSTGKTELGRQHDADIADTILAAIIQRLSTLVQQTTLDRTNLFSQSLNLAIKWDFLRFTKAEILPSLDSLRQVAAEEVLRRGLQTSLENDRPNFVQLFLALGVKFDSVDIPSLFTSGLRSEDVKSASNSLYLKAVLHHISKEDGKEERPSPAHAPCLSAEVLRMVEHSSFDSSEGQKSMHVLVWAIAMLRLDVAKCIIDNSQNKLRDVLLGFKVLHVLRGSPIARRYRAQFLRILEVSKEYEDRAIQLLHHEAPPNFLRMNGMFDQLVSIANENQEIVCTPVMIAAIEQKWQAFASKYFYLSLSLWLVELTVYLIWAFQVAKVEWVGTDSPEPQWKPSEVSTPLSHLVTIFAFINIMMAACSWRYHYSQQVRGVGFCQQQRQIVFSKSVPNAGVVLDITFIGFTIAALVLFHHGHIATFRDVVAVSIIVAAFKTLFFLRGVKSISYMIRTIFEVVQDMLPFTFILLVLILACFYAFFLLFADEPADKGFDMKLVTMVHLIFDYFDTDDNADFRDDYRSPLAILLFVVFMFFVVVVLLNLLIALMADSYDKIREKHVEQSYFEKARIILEMQALVRPFLIWFASQEKMDDYFPEKMPPLSLPGGEDAEQHDHAHGGQHRTTRVLTVRDLHWSGRVYAVKREVLRGQNELRAQIERLQKHHVNAIAQMDAKLDESLGAITARIRNESSTRKAAVPTAVAEVEAADKDGTGA